MKLFNFFKPNIEKMLLNRDVLGLEKVLSDKNEQEDVKSKAVEALRDIGDDNAVDALVLALADSVVHDHAIRGLIKIGSPKCTDRLVRLITSEKPRTAATIVDYLGRTGGPAAAAGLISSLGATSDNVRLKAVNALDKIARQGETTAKDGLVLAMGDANNDIRKNAAKALVNLGDMDMLVSLLTSAKKEQEQNCILLMDTLAEEGRENLVELLAYGINESAPRVCRKAVTLLVAEETQESLALIIKSMKSDSVQLRGLIIDALTKEDNETAQKALSEALNDPDDEIKKKAEEAVKRIEGKKALKSSSAKQGETKKKDKVKIAILWKIKNKGSIEPYSPLAVMGETLFYYSTGGYARAIDKKTGQEKWRLKLTNGDYITNSLAVENGMVYGGSIHGNLYAIQAETGVISWIFKANPKVSMSSSPFAADGSVYYSCYNQFLYSIDARDGKEQWKFEAEDSVTVGPVVADGLVYFGVGGGYLCILDAKTGRKIHSAKVNGHPHTIGIAGGTLYSGTNLRYLFSLDSAGHLKRLMEIEKPNLSIISSGIILDESQDFSLAAYDVTTMKKIWTFVTNDVRSTYPVIADGLLYVGTFGNNLYVLNLQTGKVTNKFKTPETIDNTPVISEALYCTTLSSSIFAIQI